MRKILFSLSVCFGNTITFARECVPTDREVVCITKDPTGPDDCRCIEKIGYDSSLDMVLKKDSAEVHDDIVNEGRDYYVKYRGDRTDPRIS